MTDNGIDHRRNGDQDPAAAAQMVSAAPSGSRGQFVISLDFELYWGVHDNKTVDGYGEALLGGRKAIVPTLDLFERHEIEATWATVGLLFFENAKEAADYLPAHRPNYRNPRLNSFQLLDSMGRDRSMDTYLFARDLIQEIHERPGQEVGTHTFSHYYCWDDGDDDQAFDDDLRAACEAAARLGIEIKSLVFPRNQVKASYLPICRKHGITSYRDHPGLRPYAASGSKWMRQARRARRIADSFIQTIPSYLQKPHAAAGEPVSIVGSRFLRTDAIRSPLLLKLHSRRIKDEMTRAAKEGGIFHLWWHPHNFGVQMEAKLAFLEDILEHYQTVRSRYGMLSSNMARVAEACTAEDNQMRTSFTPTRDDDRSGLEACSLT